MDLKWADFSAKSCANLLDLFYGLFWLETQTPCKSILENHGWREGMFQVQELIWCKMHSLWCEGCSEIP